MGNNPASQQRRANINELEISLEENLDIEVEYFSDCLELKSYLEGSETIKFIVVTCEESAKDIMEHIHSLPNVTHVFVYSKSDLNSNYPKIRNTCTPPLSALLKQINKTISFNRYAQPQENAKQKLIKFNQEKKLYRESASQQLEKSINITKPKKGQDEVDTKFQDNQVDPVSVQHITGPQHNKEEIGSVTTNEDRITVPKKASSLDKYQRDEERDTIQEFEIGIRKAIQDRAIITIDMVCEELCKLVPYSEREIKLALEEKYQSNVFQGIMFLYSNDNMVYQNLKTAIMDSKFQAILSTTKACFTEFEARKKMAVTKGATLYRGVQEKIEKIQDVWATFTSTFLKFSVAKEFASNEGTIFEIKLDDKFPHPHASISTISKYPEEDEIVLLPLFRFKEISRREEGNLTIIMVEQDACVEPFDKE